MTMLAEVRKLLADAGHGTENTNLFYGFLPPTPVNATCVFDSEGDQPLRTFCGGTSGVILEQPRGQVQVRRAVFVDALAECQAIYETLIGVHNVTLSGTYYESIRPTTAFTLQRDAAETPVRGLNFIARKAVS